MSAPRVLVVGGGVTGTSAAIALSRQGFPVRLAEREPVFRPLGSGITLLGPALRALSRLGVLEACLEVGAPIQEIVTTDLEGEFVGAIPLGAMAGVDAPGMLGMMRPALQDILAAAAAEAGVEISLGTEVASAEPDGDGAVVQTADGVRERFDVVVLADGWRSHTRDALFGPANPTFRHQAVFRAVVPKSPDIVTGYLFHGHEHVHSGMTPTGPETAYMFCLVAVDTRERPPQERLPELMREHLRDFGGLAAELRDAIGGPRTVDYRPLEALLVPAPWHRGRVVVAGDAAHVTTPHLAAGGAMCLEDALVLAEELGRGGSVDDGLRRFGERRFERCRYVVETSVYLSDGQMRSDTDAEEHNSRYREAVGVLAREY
jgi:2-polyprenyl-6-methoxyphenol hydroxylase-like FAD-dependent oxidoreductase